MAAPELTVTDRDELADLVRQLSVVHGRVTLSSGKEADYYVDLRRATLHHRAAPLIGRLMRELTDDWDYAAVGGLTLGADPVATAVMHAPGRPIDAFVVRKSVKTHGMQRLIEGSDVSGQRVLVVEDTSTTGDSALTAVRAVRDAGGARHRRGHRGRPGHRRRRGHRSRGTAVPQRAWVWRIWG